MRYFNRKELYNIKIKEFIIVINGEVFRVYADCKANAITILKNVSKKYTNTNNDKYKKYWNDLYKNIEKDKYIIIENEDFCGVRKIV